MKKRLTNLINTVLKTYGKLQFSRGSEGFNQIQKWLVKGYLPKTSFGVIYGKSDSRKSFIAIDISCAIATGTGWQNKSTKAGAVVYVAAEGQTSIPQRVKAWELTHKKKAEHLYILGQSINVSNLEERNDLIEAIQEIERTNDIKVEMVVLDTLARNFEGDENSSHCMGKFILGCDAIKTITKASVLCIHHSGKDISKGTRGSTSLVGACDFEYQVKHDSSTNQTTFKNTKQKDAKRASTLSFEFETVDLDLICEDNEPVTSLALVKPGSIRIEKASASKNDPLLIALNEKFGGQCTRRELRDYYAQSTKGMNSNSVTKAFSRNLETLEELGYLSYQQKGKVPQPTDVISVA